MGKKFLFEAILNKTSASDDESELSNDDSVDAESDVDSDDAELQRAFAKGELKPGLHGLVAFKRTESLINDKEGLKRKLEEIQIFKDNWLERLDLVSEPAKVTPDLKQKYGDLELKLNKKGEVSGEDSSTDRVQHDFKREMLFYRQAQSTVIDGIRLLQTKFGIKQTSRPNDYFAEMAKSDDHMKKVRERLQTKQNSIEASEKAKKQRELKKYGKKVQQEVQLKRQKEKKDLLQKIQNYKKGKEETLDFLEDEQDSKSPGKKAARPNQANDKPQKKSTKKQKYKEAKYGYGGQKKRGKYNSSDSAANVSGFSARKHGRPKVTKKKQNRPGKARRQNAKQRRS